MRVLVTGATGFLGGWVCREFVSRGYSVVGAGRNASKAKELTEAGCDFLSLDLLNVENVMTKVKGFDCVIHCAAAVAPYGPYDYFVQNNIVATKHLVDACVTNQVPNLVNISTPSIYFDYQHRLNISEEDRLPTKSASYYAATKLEAEKYALSAIARGLNVITLRPRGIFGPGDEVFVGSILKRIKNGRLPLINGGRSFIDLTYVENCVDAVELAVKNCKMHSGKIFNLTNGEPLPVSEVVSLITHALEIKVKTLSIPYSIAFAQAAIIEAFYGAFLPGRQPPLTKYGIGLASKSQTLKIDKARKLLGYEPRFSLVDGMRKSADWYRSLIVQLDRGAS